MGQAVGTLYYTRFLYRNVGGATRLQAVACCTSSELIFDELGVSPTAFTSTVLLNNAAYPALQVCFVSFNFYRILLLYAARLYDIGDA